METNIDEGSDVIRRDSFSFGYDGLALRDHQIDVRELAPALLAMADLVDAINDSVNPAGTKVKTELVATRGGSVIVQLALEVSFLETALRFVTGDPVQALINVKEVLGLSAAGVFALLKWLRGADPDSLDKYIEDRMVTMRMESGETITVPLSTFEAVHDRRVRAAAAATLEPLEDRGIDEMLLYDGDGSKGETPAEIVTRSDVPAFTIEPEEVEALPEETARTTVQVVSPQFVRKYKWRLTQGHSVFWAEIGDDEFWSQVEHGHTRFGAGDLLEVDLVNRPRLQGGKLVPEFSISRVHNHIRDRGQTTMPFAQSSEGPEQAGPPEAA